MRIVPDYDDRIVQSQCRGSLCLAVPGCLSSLQRSKGRKRLTVLLAAQQMCLFAKQSATYKGRSLLNVPRTDPGGRC